MRIPVSTHDAVRHSTPPGQQSSVCSIDGDLHVKRNPLGTRWNVRIFASVVQLRQRWDVAGRDAVAVWEEGIGPLLEKAICGCKVMRC
jgi:hypothetical protein